MATGIAELDRVLGGGLVPGSLVLIGGEPGIGKSTLVLQALAEPRRRAASAAVMLVTGEESPLQVRGRAERLDCDCGQVAGAGRDAARVGARGDRGAPAGRSARSTPCRPSTPTPSTACRARRNQVRQVTWS